MYCTHTGGIFGISVATYNDHIHSFVITFVHIATCTVWWQWFNDNIVQLCQYTIYDVVYVYTTLMCAA